MATSTDMNKSMHFAKINNRSNTIKANRDQNSKFLHIINTKRIGSGKILTFCFDNPDQDPAAR